MRTVVFLKFFQVDQFWIFSIYSHGANGEFWIASITTRRFSWRNGLKKTAKTHAQLKFQFVTDRDRQAHRQKLEIIANCSQDFITIFFHILSFCSVRIRAASFSDNRCKKTKVGVEKTIKSRRLSYTTCRHNTSYGNFYQTDNNYCFSHTEYLWWRLVSDLLHFRSIKECRKPFSAVYLEQNKTS